MVSGYGEINIYFKIVLSYQIYDNKSQSNCQPPNFLFSRFDLLANFGGGC